MNWLQKDTKVRATFQSRIQSYCMLTSLGVLIGVGTNHTLTEGNHVGHSGHVKMPRCVFFLPASAWDDWLWLYLWFPAPGQGVRNESLRACWINSAYFVLRLCPLISLSVYTINKSSPSSPQLPRSLHLYVQLPRQWNQAPLAFLLNPDANW